MVPARWRLCRDLVLAEIFDREIERIHLSRSLIGDTFARKRRRPTAEIAPPQGPRAALRFSANDVVNLHLVISNAIPEPSVASSLNRLTSPPSAIASRRPSRGSTPSSFLTFTRIHPGRTVNTLSAVGVSATRKLSGRRAPLPP